MLNKKLIVSAFLAVSSAVLITACDDDKNKSVNVEDVKSNYVDMAYAVYSDSLSTAKELEVAVDALLEDPSKEALDAARVAYKATRKPYQQSEIMRWDESITADKNLAKDGGLASVNDWEGQVNAWPLDEYQIEVIIINGTSQITKDLLEEQNGVATGNEGEDPSTVGDRNITTGVHAIEYLLWDQDKKGPARGAGDRQFDEFAKVGGCHVPGVTEKCRRSQYLKAATELLVSDLEKMQKEWSPSSANKEGSLAYNYLNSEHALDYMTQSIAAMAVGELGGARLSAGLWRPALLTEDKMPKVGDYEEEHDCFSDLSHYAVYYNFQGIMNAWGGTYTKLDGTVVRGASLAGYAQSIAAKDYEKLNAALLAAQTEMKKIYDAGEKEGDDRKSFDQIIADSESFYTDKVAKKSAELEATENAIKHLAKVERMMSDLVAAMSLEQLDTETTGETD